MLPPYLCGEAVLHLVKSTPVRVFYLSLLIRPPSLILTERDDVSLHVVKNSSLGLTTDQ